MRPYCMNPWLPECLRVFIDLDHVIRAEPDYHPFYGGVGGKNPLIRVVFSDGKEIEYWMPNNTTAAMKEDLEREWKRFQDAYMAPSLESWPHNLPFAEEARAHDAAISYADASALLKDLET